MLRFHRNVMSKKLFADKTPRLIDPSRLASTRKICRVIDIPSIIKTAKRRLCMYWQNIRIFQTYKRPIVTGITMYVFAIIRNENRTINRVICTLRIEICQHLIEITHYITSWRAYVLLRRP